ncbi:MAG: AtpZ/AtpI family protein [Sediminibacterium sp.]
MTQKDPRPFLQYASVATQLLVAFAFAAFGGKWLDLKFFSRTPVFIWILPLLVGIGMIVKVIKDTDSKAGANKDMHKTDTKK